MKTCIKYGVVAVLVILIAARGVAHKPKTMAVPPSGRSVAAHSTQPSPNLNPLTIEAMKMRKYSASPITAQRSLGDKGGYTASVVSFVSDGFTENGYWAQPTGSMPAGGWPAIVLVHGYIPPSQYNTVTDAYVPWIAAWARAGFVVVQPDLRGNGSSQGAAVSGHWSPAYDYDVMNLVASLKKDALINPKHIGLVGHSMGGHVALNVAVISPDIASTVLVNGVVGSMYDLFYNWPNSPAPNDQPAAEVRQELAELVNTYGTPKTGPAFWNSVSAINFASSIRSPVQINADIGDTTVPITFSEHLDTALKAANKIVTFYQYPGDDHQLSDPANLSLFLQRSTAFFKKTL